MSVCRFQCVFCACVCVHASANERNRCVCVHAEGGGRKEFECAVYEHERCVSGMHGHRLVDDLRWELNGPTICFPQKTPTPLQLSNSAGLLAISALRSFLPLCMPSSLPKMALPFISSSLSLTRSIRTFFSLSISLPRFYLSDL